MVGRDAGTAAAGTAAVRNRRGGAEQRGGVMGAAFNAFPLILIPVLIYNIIALGGTMVAGGSDIEAARDIVSRINGPAFGDGIPMASDMRWVVTWGDILLFLSLVLLFIELLKSTSTGAVAIFNHGLSMVVFIICLLQFILHPAFATSTFFLIMIMSLLDVLAGVIVTIVSARRDVGFENQQ